EDEIIKNVNYTNELYTTGVTQSKLIWEEEIYETIEKEEKFINMYKKDEDNPNYDKYNVSLDSEWRRKKVKNGDVNFEKFEDFIKEKYYENNREIIGYYVFESTQDTSNYDKGIILSIVTDRIIQDSIEDNFQLLEKLIMNPMYYNWKNVNDSDDFNTETARFSNITMNVNRYINNDIEWGDKNISQDVNIYLNPYITNSIDQRFILSLNVDYVREITNNDINKIVNINW
ncbi:MAG: hypothetical protein ACOCP8_05390, partial [archaeon]